MKPHARVIELLIPTGIVRAISPRAKRGAQGGPERTEYRKLILGATEGIPKHALGQGLPLDPSSGAYNGMPLYLACSANSWPE